MTPVGAGYIRAAAQVRSTGARRAPLPRLAGTRGWPGRPPVTAGAGQRLAGLGPALLPSRPPGRLAGRAAAPVPPQGLAPPRARGARQTKGAEAGAAAREEGGGQEANRTGPIHWLPLHRTSPPRPAVRGGGAGRRCARCPGDAHPAEAAVSRSRRGPLPGHLSGAHGGGEPAMAAACRRHGYGCGCGARAQPGGGSRAAGIPAPSSACPAAPAARRTPPALCGPSAPQKPGPFPYSGLGASPRARSRLAAAGNPRGAAGSRAGREAGRRSGFVSPGPFLSPPRAPVCDRSAGLQELIHEVHRELPPLFLQGGSPSLVAPGQRSLSRPRCPAARRRPCPPPRPACAGEGMGEGGR
ncbi:translation initiation factor IF-2-like [Motacilla alba alba]|uniref:translation initiation factor IF-2-like n=1 Tax=Motacilla alba alba TaxID=1094192 RepID=UPI0018D50D2B|nr:translation initiation factor IF-2-like [Motacilla alba alba]